MVANPDEPADPEGGRGFAEWAMLTLHALRIELGRIMNPLDHAHNARVDGDRYHQRPMSETALSSVKRTLGAAVRARHWWLEFRERLRKATVYNLPRSMRYP